MLTELTLPVIGIDDVPDSPPRAARDLQALSDDALMVAVAGDVGDALDLLIARFRVPLFAFLVRYTGDRSLAEDLLQETFIRVYRKRHLYDRHQPARPWLYRIAMNLAIDHFRRAAVATVQATVAVEEAADGQDSLVDSAIRQDVRREIAGAVAALPPAQRAAFILHQFDGLNYSEISRVTGRRLNTVKSDMRRALAALRRCLGKQGDRR
jgi:RNA polymerase sigma-70 factor (ECF subfamily)